MGDAPKNDTERINGSLHRVAALRSAAARQAAPGLSARQLQALSTVQQRPRLTLTGLAQALGVGLPATSRLCDRLEAAGLLDRSVPPDNRRRLLLTVTGRGRRLLGDVRAAHLERLAGVLGRMPAPRRSDLLDGMAALRTALEAALPGPDEGRERPE